MRHLRCTRIVALLNVLLTALPCGARIWDVNELGAQGDKRTNDTPVIQRAIDNAAQAGGGTVYIPAGDYRCGQLQLRSHVTLHLESGATLWVSPDKADYQRGSTFLLAQDQNDITIEGRGTIHGTGREDLQRKRGDKRPRPDWRVGILIQGMTNGRIEDVSLRNITMRIDKAADYARRKKHVGGKTEKTEDRRETIFARQSSYVTIANLDGLTVNGLRVLIPDEVFAKYNRSALSLHSVSKATLTGIRREPPGADSTVPVVMMEDCRNALLTGCLALPNSGVFLGLAGKETANISLKANDLTSAREAVHVSKEAPNGSIRD